MTRRSTLIATGIALLALAGTASAMMLQGDAAAALRASGDAGEQADGYLGAVGNADPALRSKIDAINIKRRAYYTDLAGRRGAKIEEVAATTACELFRTKVGPGQYYRGASGGWRQRADGEPVPLPGYCG